MLPRLSARLLALIGGAALFAGSCLAGTLPSKSLYRLNAPRVLTPAPEADPPARSDPSAIALKAFGAAYRKAGSPRVAIFWNRTLSDRLTEHETRLRVVHSRENVTRTGKGGRLSPSATSSDESTVSVKYGKNEAPRPSPLPEVAGLKVETGYARAFLEAGVNLINRASIMRLTHAKNAREALRARTGDDRQFIETEALKGHADLLIQIRMAPSPKSKSGAFFQISALDVKTGKMKASFFNDASPRGKAKARGKAKWTAARGGYVRVVEKERTRKPGFEEMGRMLALQTMNELLRVWK